MLSSTREEVQEKEDAQGQVALRIVSLSGGATSAVCADKVLQRYGSEKVVPGTKYCPKCHAEKSREDFSRCVSRYDGLQGYCRACRQALYALRAPSNRERRRQYYLQVAPATRAKQQRWREQNRERHRAYSRRWYRDHPEQAKEAIDHHRARLFNAVGSHTRAEWWALCERYGNRCLRCGKCPPEIQLSRDHVVPLSCGGTNFIDNIQPLCTTCNKKKHTLTVDYRLEAA